MSSSGVEMGVIVPFAASARVFCEKTEALVDSADCAVEVLNE